MTTYRPDPQGGIDIRDYVAMVMDARWLIITITLLVMALAGAYHLLAAPIYKPNALVQVHDRHKFVETITHSREPEAPPQKSLANDEHTIVASRSVLGNVVDRLKLMIDVQPRHLPVLGGAVARHYDMEEGPSAPWFGLHNFAWGGETIAVPIFHVAKEFYDETFTVVAGRAGRYRLLGPDGDTLITGKLGAEIRTGAAADIPARIRVAALNARPGTQFVLSRKSRLSAIEDLQRALTVTQTSEDSDILKIEFGGKDPARSTRIVNEIVAEYADHKTRWNSIEAEQKLKFARSQLPNLKRRVKAAEAALSAYRESNDAVDLSQQGRSILNQIAAHKLSLLELNQEHVVLSQLATPNHPRMIALNARMAQVKKSIESLGDSMANLPETERGMMRLVRDVNVSTSLYTTLMKAAQEQRLIKAGTMADVTILDHAVVPEKPAGPGFGILSAAAGVCGAFLGLVVVFARSALLRGVRDADSIERALDLPVYVALPYSKQQDKMGVDFWRRSPRVLAARRPDDLAVEGLRTLRATLPETRGTVTMICGPAAGMGKSFVCTNLGVVLANAGARVLLIDADLRGGRLHEAFGVSSKQGLSELLNDGEGRIHDTRVDGLSLMTRGAFPRQPSELLLRARLRQELERLKEIYDHIIIDSPPVLSVVDATIIGRHADRAVMVVKAGAVTMRQIAHGTHRLQRANVNVSGFLLNGLDPRGARYGYEYYGYRTA
jgi:tyrosine-protein kinase Etk/Wzc